MEDKESANLRRQLKGKRTQLSKLISKPLLPKGFSGKYLDDSVHVQLQQNIQTAQTAVQLMKKSIDDNPKSEKRKLERKNKQVEGIASTSHAIKKRKFKRGRKQK